VSAAIDTEARRELALKVPEKLGKMSAKARIRFDDDGRAVAIGGAHESWAQQEAGGEEGSRAQSHGTGLSCIRSDEANPSF
jgi:hypothetical protein